MDRVGKYSHQFLHSHLKANSCFQRNFLLYYLKNTGMFLIENTFFKILDMTSRFRKNYLLKYIDIKHSCK